MISFFEHMYTAFTQISVLAVIVIIGFLCDRSGLYIEKTARLTNNLLFYIITPAIIAHSFTRIEFTKETGKLFFIALLCGLALQLFSCVLILPFFNKHPDGCIFKYASAYGNVGYMGLPLVSAVLGEIGVFISSIMVVTFNLFAFTHGVILMTKDKKDAGGLQISKILINPGTIGILIGLPLFLFNIPLPTIAAQPLEMIANLNTPIAMIMLGTYMANTDLRTTLSQKESYLVVLLKLIVLPGVLLLGGWLCGLRGTILVALAITAGTPSATNSVMFAAKYGKNAGLASKVTALCSILSVATLPIWIALAKML